MNKVYILPPDESWIVDRFVKDWYDDITNSKMSTKNPEEADVIWLFADWCYGRLPRELLHRKKVLTTVHHIVPEKFGWIEKNEFAFRDVITNAYHVPNIHTWRTVKDLTKKDINIIPYWANQFIWSLTELPDVGKFIPLTPTKQVKEY